MKRAWVLTHDGVLLSQVVLEVFVRGMRDDVKWKCDTHALVDTSALEGLKDCDLRLEVCITVD
jgi:hypothetical protein